MSLGLEFPLRFDPALLASDLSRILPEEWIPHYNELDYGGDWRVVALRSPSGRADQIYANTAPRSTLLDTPALKRCPYLQQVISVFACPLRSARLLSLAPQSYIREHSDNALAYEEGEIRIHVPIHTNPGVEFYVAGERLLLEPGHCYYVNVNLPHRVNNRGVEDRVHLVVDAEVNDWVRALVAEARPIPRCDPPPRGFAAFRERVLADPELQRKLRAVTDREQLIRTTVHAGRDTGFDFHEADVDAAFQAARRVLAERPA